MARPEGVIDEIVRGAPPAADVVDSLTRARRNIGAQQAIPPRVCGHGAAGSEAERGAQLADEA